MNVFAWYQRSVVVRLLDYEREDLGSKSHSLMMLTGYLGPVSIYSSNLLHGIVARIEWEKRPCSILNSLEEQRDKKYVLNKLVPN